MEFFPRDGSGDTGAARAQLERATALRAQVESTCGEARSPGGEVWVEVDSGGRVLATTLSEDALRLGTERLEAMITATAQAAHRRAAMKVAGLAEDAFGEGSALARKVYAELDSRLVVNPGPGAGQRSMGQQSSPGSGSR